MPTEANWDCFTFQFSSLFGEATKEDTKGEDVVRLFELGKKNPRVARGFQVISY